MYVVAVLMMNVNVLADIEMAELKDELQICHTLINSLLDRVSALETDRQSTPDKYKDNTSSKPYK